MLQICSCLKRGEAEEEEEEEELAFLIPLTSTWLLWQELPETGRQTQRVDSSSPFLPSFVLLT